MDLIPLLLLLLPAQCAAELGLTPHSLRVLGAAGDFVEPGAPLRLRWGLRCDEAEEQRCRGLRQRSYRAVVTAAESGEVAHDSGVFLDSSPFCALQTAKLEPDAAYSVMVQTEAGRVASATFRTALPGEVPAASAPWRGAEWISGGTQLRGSFHAPKPVKSATAYASGVGVFAMTLNGRNVSDSFLDPGFSTVPSWRMLYRAFDVTAQIVTGENAVGVRLGQGKYGYLESYCTPSDSFQPACRAFLLCLSMTFTDGTQQNFTTSADGGWTVHNRGQPCLLHPSVPRRAVRRPA